METTLQNKYERLKEIVAGMGSALVSFSGGVDSSLVLAVGKEALGDNVIAVTVHSDLHPPRMLENAVAVAARLKVEHLTIANDELENEGFAANPPERCYLCKHERFEKLIEVANREGSLEVVEGSQLDDTSDYRPGLDAASELGVRSPLIEAEFAKYEVRALSRELGLTTWNEPPSTCLATRIPYYQRVTREKLAIVEKGEEFLTGLGFAQVRLRYIDDRTARIEVAPGSLQLLVSEGTRERVLDRMKALGFTYVTVDLAGYRTGALNEALGEL